MPSDGGSGPGGGDPSGGAAGGGKAGGGSGGNGGGYGGNFGGYGGLGIGNPGSYGGTNGANNGRGARGGGMPDGLAEAMGRAARAGLGVDVSGMLGDTAMSEGVSGFSGEMADLALDSIANSAKGFGSYTGQVNSAFSNLSKNMDFTDRLSLAYGFYDRNTPKTLSRSLNALPTGTALGMATIGKIGGAIGAALSGNLVGHADAGEGERGGTNPSIPSSLSDRDLIVMAEDTKTENTGIPSSLLRQVQYLRNL